MAKQRITHRGKTYRVLRTLSIGKRPYHLLKDLSDQRERYQAFDPYAGPDGDLRAVWVFPRTSYVEKQIRLVARVSEANANFPTILEYHPVGRRLFVVATWIRGQDLAAYLDDVRSGRFPNARPSPGEAVRLARGLAHGVSNLNQKKNIVHGDIKPANIVLMREPSRLCLIDFGSSWFVEQTLCARRSDGASPAYAAPELLDQDGSLGVPDFRSDQFATMVVLYELLTLQLPYSGLGGAAGMDSRHRVAMEGELVVPSRFPGIGLHGLSANAWRKLDRLVAKGLRLDPGQRYQNRREWLRAFDQIHASLMHGDDESVLLRSFQDAMEWPWRAWREWRGRHRHQ
ncbi:MAG: hypothetical protein CMJ58_15125 [Planctomycetaceae bacterium]|nr:hypothetical protein [Planctomycetaceae bacterium]